ncbi:MAG: hypothetical protein ACI4O7_09115 [Aristaeellaceae bacterium]
MSDFMIYALTILIISVVRPLIVHLRNISYENSPAGENARQSLKEFARTALCEGETLLLSDYSHLARASVLMTDQGFHFRQTKRSREIAVDAAYRQIISCTFRDCSGSKVRNPDRVNDIQLHTSEGDCVLSCFPQSEAIARLLIERGW